LGSGSAFRLALAFHFLLRVDAVAVPVQGNAVVHATLPHGRLAEEFASLLVEQAWPCPAVGHESADAVVDVSASTLRPVKAFDACSLATAFIDAHGSGSIINRRRRVGLRPY
jgi:hypothetical protein